MKKKPIYFIIVTLAVILVYFLSRVFSGSIILPQSFSLGPLTIHYYGLVISVAVFAALWLASSRTEKYNIQKQHGSDAVFWVLVAGFVGARLYHIVSSLSFYVHSPLEIVKVWHGGLSIYGAVIGGVIGLLLYLKSIGQLQRAWVYLDWLAPSVILGQAIGRFGNFFNYELFGYPTNLPWKMFVPFWFRPSDFASFVYFHPLFLYESLANLLILLFLLFYKKITRPGTLFLSYVFLYNMVRFGLEFLRIDSTLLNGVRINAWVSFALAAASLLVIILRNERSKAS